MKFNEYRADLGGASVVIRFEFETEERGHGAHPDYPAWVEIQEVQIGDVWVAPNLFADEWLTAKEDEILADMGKSLQEEHDMSRWEAQQESLMEEGYP